MDMFSKLTSLFQQALETREPSVNLLDSFVEHWKGITNYYIVTNDETQPVKQTDIPWRLKQMLDILVYEEGEQGLEETGPCMEYLLQHKLLETLCTLGKAQYPPGMNQQVLIFFSKLLAQIQKPVLHLINIYRPVQKLIRLCGLPGSQAEKEEAQFLLVVCSRIKQDPYILNYILEITQGMLSKRSSSTSEEKSDASNKETVPSDQSPSSASTPSQSESTTPSPGPTPSSPSFPPPDNTGLIHVLMHLSRSQKSRVALKAYESLLLLTSVQREETLKVLAEMTPLCPLLAGRLCEFYSLIPSSLDPGDILSLPHTHWSTQFSQGGIEDSVSFPGSDVMERFFSWLDYLDHLMNEAPKILAVKLAGEIHQQLLVNKLQPQLLQMSEAGVLVGTALLGRMVRHVQSAALLDELVNYILGRETEGELRLDTETHVLRYHLIEHCDHVSDEISIISLRLFEELLQKPHRDILSNLVLRNLERRCYATHTLGDDRHHQYEALEDSEELEEDPFFTDSLYPDSDFCPDQLPQRTPSLSGEPPHNQAADSVNSFLCLVPQEAKSSHLLQGAGYNTYVHDAHKLLKDCTALSQGWDWPDTPVQSDSSAVSSDFFEGHFLKVLFDRIGRILEQPYELNLQVTSVLSRLSVFPHPLLHEYLLDPYISLAPDARSLFSVLIRVIGELMQRIQIVSNVTEKLVQVRGQLMGLEAETGVDHVTLLKGVIVLEEFCKELAAIAFVKLPSASY
ncbi:FHF complex subunit HOOK interacting protein 2B [Hypomesus transpacificus]|uniref:FHF complex subunit HOOK interacting protein 2B n=1 Tax=Hypomesus transpacificus TaxID=137520 RepID=UPI001F08285B|nr:FHF complex subunit HOOK interacting protein 2B [Hypomesus transpacificus]